MSILPFFSSFILIINPALLWLFKRFNQNLQKLQFWVMLTTGMAWVISLVFFFAAPDQHLNPIWDAGETLLPSLAFSLDRISISFFLAVTSLLFFAVLVEGHSPQTSAWISGLGGVCAIGTLVDSAYTLALVWTAIESFSLYGFLKNQGEIEGSRRYILGILLRLAAPLLVIFISVVNSTTGVAPFLTDLPSSAAPILLAAGVIASGGWFFGTRDFQGKQPVIQPGIYACYAPAAVGLVMITRAAQIINDNQLTPISILGVSIVVFLSYLASALFHPSEKNWRIGGLALLLGGFIFAEPESVLIWGVIFLLTGTLLIRDFEAKRALSLALILGGIAILPLPYFPAWTGMVSFKGIPGLFFSIPAGIVLGKTLNRNIRALKNFELDAEQLSPVLLTGYAVILISLFSITVQAGLRSKNLALAAAPISVWIAGGVFAATAILWDRIPKIILFRWEKTTTRIKEFGAAAAGTFPELAGRAINLVTRVFEGEGGLIWTLLVGFLILTLISLRGG